MSDVQILARALLVHAQEPEIAGLLFAEAEIGAAVTWGAEIPAAQLIAEKLGPVARVISIAQSTKNPDVLAVLAKDTRVTVAFAVASNRNLDESTARKIHSRANTKGRSDILAAVLSNISTIEVLAARPTSAIGWAEFPTHEIIKRYAGDGPWPRDEIESMLTATHDGIAIHALKACYDGKCPGLSVTDAAEMIDSRMRPRCIAQVVAQTSRVNLELAQAYLACRIEAFREVGARGATDTRVWDVDATNAMFDGITLEELKFMVRHELEADNIDRAVDLVEQIGDAETHRHMLMVNAKHLTAHQTSRLLAPIGNPDSIEAHSPAHLAEIITAATTEISTPDMLRLMSAATPSVVAYWAGGTYGRNEPRRGEISTVMASAPHNTDSAQMEVAKLVANQFYMYIDNDMIVDELVDSLGRWMLPYMKSTSTVAKYAAARFARVFGTDRELWNTTLRLAEGWNGSLGDLMDVAFLTTGRQPPRRAIEHDVVLLPSPETAEGQLCLSW